MNENFMDRHYIPVEKTIVTIKCSQCGSEKKSSSDVVEFICAECLTSSKMPKENSLKNLYSVWGSKPLDYLFNNESVQFFSDLAFEGITSDEYMEYARKQR